MKESRKKFIAALVIIAAIVFTSVAVGCQKSGKDAMLSADQIKGIKLNTDTSKIPEKPLTGITDLSKQLDSGQGYIMPLPSAYAAVAQNYKFKFIPIKNVRTGTDFSGLERKALNLGIRAADAIAILYVDPKDERLSALGKDMLEFARSLGVSKALSDELATMGEQLKSGDAAKVRGTIDSMTQRVDFELKKINMRELAVLVSLGGWSEILHNVALSLEAEMNVDVASGVLPVAEIAATYKSSLAQFFPGKIASDPLISLLYNDIGRVGDVFAMMAGSKDSAALKQGVSELIKISAEMVTASADNKGGSK